MYLDVEQCMTRAARRNAGQCTRSSVPWSMRQCMTGPMSRSAPPPMRRNVMDMVIIKSVRR